MRLIYGSKTWLHKNFDLTIIMMMMMMIIIIKSVLTGTGVCRRTVVQLCQLPRVDWAECNPLTNPGVLILWHDGVLSILAEIVLPVMHYGSIVIRRAKS